MPKIIPIVEGDGDVQAVPALVRRILSEAFGASEWTAERPKKAGSLGALKQRLQSFLTYASSETDCGGILILLDLDDGCPKEEALALAQQVRAMNVTVPVAVVLAHREYETWFLASIESIKGTYDLPVELEYVGSVEARRGAKEWLTEHMPPGTIYKETHHQVRMTQLIDLEQAGRNSRSFRRLCHAIEEIIFFDPQLADCLITP